MFEQGEIFIRRLRNRLSRSQLLIRLFGLSKWDKKAPHHKGVVIIQIDALSKKQLEKALSKGRLPFIKNLLDKQHYSLYSHYSGMPCSTASVQAELFYGVKSAVPAFSFYDNSTRRVFTMFNPADAMAIEKRAEKKGKPLLKGGSAYSDIYTGGADESHFCISELGLSGIFKNHRPLGFLALAFLNFYSLIRTAILLGIEMCLAVVDFFRGLIKGRDLWKELKFVPSRVAMCVLLRELIVIGAKIDLARGMPIIHLNLMGYHEQSHRRGATSRFAHWTLRGIDDAVKRIWFAAHRSAVRDYDVWIYSDHGQIDTIPYQKKVGKNIQQSIKDIFDELQFSPETSKKKKIGFLARAGFRGAGFFDQLFPLPFAREEDKPIVTSLGPMGHIYLRETLDSDEIAYFIDNIIHKAHVPMVIFPHKNAPQKGIEIWTQNGHYSLPDQADKIFDPHVPFFDEMVEDFLRACRHPDSGDVIISGWDKKNKTNYSFAVENGSHGGLTSDETEAFAILPKKLLMSDTNRDYIRPLDLRAAALRLIEGVKEESDRTYFHLAAERNTFRIMTYNVHGCVGLDGKLSPRRIADVIAQYEPNIVALQELDVGRLRSGREDQAMIIAEHLNMSHHFHAAMRVAEESFGDAILSSFPMQLIKKDALSRKLNLPFFETRGALWSKVYFKDLPIQILNTHLGLNPKERLFHAKELLNREWLGHPQCKGSVILCGDFNAFPKSKVFKEFINKLDSVQTAAVKTRHKGTWFGRYPFASVDHIFVNQEIEVINVEVADSYLARLASDHRPLLADLKFKSS